jgi:hypothetical protein
MISFQFTASVIPVNVFPCMYLPYSADMSFATVANGGSNLAGEESIQHSPIKLNYYLPEIHALPLAR